MEWPGISAADQCCQDLHKCPATLAPNHFLFGLLNIFQYRMYQCECLEYFKECLDDAGDEEAMEIKRVFFDATDMRCFKKEEYDVCEDYKLPWFDECLESDVGYVNYIEELRNM